jgi:hypothetical protein
MAAHRKTIDDLLLAALSCGAAVPQAAHQAGVSPRTVYRRLADPAFQDHLKAARAELLRRTGGMLTAGALEAVKTLFELQKASAPPSVRLGAARAVVELGLKVRDRLHPKEVFRVKLFGLPIYTEMIDAGEGIGLTAARATHAHLPERCARHGLRRGTPAMRVEMRLVTSIQLPADGRQKPMSCGQVRQAHVPGTCSRDSEKLA